MRQLKRRGLAGVKPVISDAHEGIKATVTRAAAAWATSMVAPEVWRAMGSK